MSVIEACRINWIGFFSGVRIAQSLISCVMFCRLLFFLWPCVVFPFVLFLLAIVLFVLWFTYSDYTFGIYDLQILITPLVSMIYIFWLHLWYLWFTDSDYTFGIYDLHILITPLVSMIYIFWLHLWYLQTLLATIEWWITNLIYK